MTEADIQQLRRVIHDVHGVTSSHIRSDVVNERLQDGTAWFGNVEVFAISGHPQAKLVYAWSQQTDRGSHRFIAILGVPPIASARDAVRAAVAREAEGRRRA